MLKGRKEQQKITKRKQHGDEQSSQITKTIKLLHKKTEEVEEVDLEQYLYHVVSAEMPADFELEALKAQAVVARTYTLFKAQNNDRTAC